MLNVLSSRHDLRIDAFDIRYQEINVSFRLRFKLTTRYFNTVTYQQVYNAFDAILNYVKY